LPYRNTAVLRDHASLRAANALKVSSFEKQDQVSKKRIKIPQAFFTPHHGRCRQQGNHVIKGNNGIQGHCCNEVSLSFFKKISIKTPVKR
jgi:hypothetical protein